MCVTFNENDFKWPVFIYFYYNMKEAIKDDLSDMEGMLDVCLRKLAPAEAAAEGYEFRLDLCGSDEAIAEAHFQLDKLVQSLVIVEKDMPFSRLTWEFLRWMQQKFRTDQGSILLNLLPISRSNVIRIYFVAPQQRKDLVEFVVKGIEQNCCQSTFTHQENQTEQIEAYLANFSGPIIADDVLLLWDRTDKIVYFISMGDAGKKWCTHLTNRLNN